MLTNLQTIHRPESLEEALELLRSPGVYPIYGSGASLVRLDRNDIDEGVDLAGLVDSQCVVNKGTTIGSGATVETIIALDPQFEGILRNESPETLSNVLTLGDVLMECQSDSLLLTLLVGLKGQLRLVGHDELFSLEQWFDSTLEDRRQQIVINAELPEYRPDMGWRVVLEKVSRTPADAPIVGALGFARGGSRGTAVVQFFCALCGVAEHPIRVKPRDLPTLVATIDDYKGSAEYRTEMAKLLANRAVMQAVSATQDE